MPPSRLYGRVGACSGEGSVVCSVGLHAKAQGSEAICAAEGTTNEHQFTPIGGRSNDWSRRGKRNALDANCPSFAALPVELSHREHRGMERDRTEYRGFSSVLSVSSVAKSVA